MGLFMPYPLLEINDLINTRKLKRARNKLYNYKRSERDDSWYLLKCKVEYYSSHYTAAIQALEAINNSIGQEKTFWLAKNFYRKALAVKDSHEKIDYFTKAISHYKILPNIKYHERCELANCYFQLFQLQPHHLKNDYKSNLSLLLSSVDFKGRASFLFIKHADCELYYGNNSLALHLLMKVKDWWISFGVLKRLESYRSSFLRGVDPGARKTAWFSWTVL